MKRIETLNLGKHFTIIDSPVPFWLIDNYGFRAYRPAGAWQFDNWKLLPENFHKIYPVYTLSIEWESGDDDSVKITFTETDLDLGDGIAGVNGQPVFVNGQITVNPVTIASPTIEDQGQKMIPVRLFQNSDLEVQNKLTFGDWNLYESFDEIPIGHYLCTGFIALDSVPVYINNAVGLHYDSLLVFSSGQITKDGKEVIYIQLEKEEITSLHLIMRRF